jgi:hypothetical protein
MTFVQQLLSLADDLRRIDLDHLGLSYASRRRAVSTAYYAVFHALAGCCADELLGGTDRYSTDYERVYRALDHGPLRTAFANQPLKDNPKLNEIGGHVARLQSERHRADYFPGKRLFTPAQCMELIDIAKTVVELLDSLDAKDRRMLAVSLLFKNRPQ